MERQDCKGISNSIVKKVLRFNLLKEIVYKFGKITLSEGQEFVHPDTC